MKSISMFAGVLSVAAVATASPNPLSHPNTSTISETAGQVPAEFASLVSEDAIAVAWIADPGSFVNSISRYLPAGMPIPPSMNPVLSSVMHSDQQIPMSTSVMIWLESSKGPTGQTAGDPKAFIAMKLPGADSKNTHGMMGTTLIFEGDMVIAAQGDSVKWSKPDKSNARLVNGLPNKPVAVAADIAQIWKEQGSQLQMLGGFGAMAAQMQLMQQTQNAQGNPDQQKSMRQMQQKAGQMMRSGMNGMFGVIAKMTFMTMSIDVEQGVGDIEMDFMFSENIGLDQGVADNLIAKLPAGMPMYMAMNSKFFQGMMGLETGIMEAMMTGLDAKQRTDFDSAMQMNTSLMNSVTEGIAVGLNVDNNGMSKWVEIGVDDANGFISGFGPVASKFSATDMGFNMKETGKGQWAIDVDGSKLGKSMGNAIMGQELSREWGASAELTMSSQGKNTVVAKVLSANNTFPSSTNTAIRNLLKPPAGRSLVGAMAMDLREIVAIAVEQSKAKDAPSPAQIRGMGEAVPFKIQGSAKGDSMRIDLAIGLEGLGQFVEAAEQFGS